MSKLRIQLWCGVVIAFLGLLLIFLGLFIPPIGIIDSSVLIGFGEVATFSGSLIGIDYKYSYDKLRSKDL